MWEVLQRGSPQQFIIDEAIADLRDPRVVAEVNRYRGKKDLHMTLGDMQKEARKCLMDIEKEYLVVQRDMVDSMNRIKKAGLYDTLQMQLRRLFDPPVIPDHHYSPEPVPLAPRTKGPTEMLVLMEGNSDRVRCFHCKRRVLRSIKHSKLGLSSPWLKVLSVV